MIFNKQKQQRTLLLLQITAKQVVELQAVHVAPAVKMSLQLKELSHPFAGLKSLLKFPAWQDTAVHMEESEQAVHMALGLAIALQLKELSHPFAGLKSLSKFPARHAVKPVHVEESEHSVHVAPATEGQPASHPLLAMPSSLNLLAKHDTLVQEDKSEQSEHEALATEMAAQYLPPRQVTLRTVHIPEPVHTAVLFLQFVATVLLQGANEGEEEAK